MGKIAQILGAIVCSVPFAVMVVLISIFPYFWAMRVSTFQLICILIIWVMVQIAAVHIIMLFLFVFEPLLRENVVAFLLSIGIVAAISIIEMIRIWKDIASDGFSLLIILCFFLSIAVIKNVFHTIGGMYVCYRGEI